MRAIAFVVLLSVVLITTTALADVPGQISYQGTLTDTYGVALDTTVSMTFSIYGDSTGLYSVWAETQLAVEVSDGIFNVLLGSVTPIPETVFPGPPRWLGVQVGGDPELSPLHKLVSVPYAFHAAEAETADYALDAPAAADGDWTISGNDMYSAVSGDVGIGTSSPNAKLDVAGDVNTDSLYKLRDYTVLASPGGFDNIHVGVGAGQNSTGNYETFLGNNAGPNNEGDANTFLGYFAGYSNATGQSNTFVGNSAGYFNTTGNYNTFLGRSAGQSNTTGYDNTLVGHYAGFFNETGNYNTFLGTKAGLNSTGTSNTFIGHYTGYDNTGGNYNTFVGRYAGGDNTTGSNNVYLGYATGYYNTTGGSNVFAGNFAGYNNTGSSNIFIGHYAGYDETGSNKLYIDNTTTSSPLVWGDFNSDILAVNGRLGVGTTAPSYQMEVETSLSRAVSCRTTLNSSSAYGVYGEAAPGANVDAKGVYGTCDPSDGYGYGVYGLGGYMGVYGSGGRMGVYGRVSEVGVSGSTYYGARGYVYLSNGNQDGTAYGVYGYAYGGGVSYGVYYSGGLGGSGSKSAIVRTDDGPKAVYCQESPENWFEDFGSGQIQGGRAEVRLANDFRQTVTVNGTHPMKVFITPNTRIGEWWVEKGTAGFTLVAPAAPEGAQFDYRVVAKRRGYEDLRLEQTPAAWMDHFLYPDVNDVPLQYREEWVRNASAEQESE